ncbi:MAG: hypothetical protein RLZZ139_2146 [Cyanobacteriota bacterium]|jgi:hypothetical protein
MAALCTAIFLLGFVTLFLKSESISKDFFLIIQMATLTNIKETRKIYLEQVKQFKNTLWAIDQIANSLLIKTNFRISASTVRKS